MSTGAAIIISTILVLAAAGAWRISVARRWGTVGKIFGVIVLLIFMIIGGYSAYDWYQRRPEVTESLSDIRLGMTEAEVVVEMGKPNSISEGESYKVLIYTRDYDQDYGFSVSISKIDKKVDIVCESGSYSDPYLSNYVSESDLKERFGNPDSSEVDPNGEFKSLAYPKYNVTFLIRRGDVSGVCLSEKAERFLA